MKRFHRFRGSLSLLSPLRAHLERRVRATACVDCGRHQRLHQTRVRTHSDVGVPAEVPLAALFHLMHLAIALPVPVLRRGRRHLSAWVIPRRCTKCQSADWNSYSPDCHERIKSRRQPRRRTGQPREPGQRSASGCLYANTAPPSNPARRPAERSGPMHVDNSVQPTRR